MKTLRCAVYTRKSTEDGLEQEFNSLDAQREACEAYILSQRHEGWSLVPDSYDDGGFSGGNMMRPGLVRLLEEVDAGNIDIIVVYKVDRLTRSLADFAKIVERLDAREASFVSVTQAFNTTTSMGRLTLNVLLSFAQFEREVTGERIRDKIAASKRKGLWMGGPVPLGYEVIDRKLVAVPEEAERVRSIMLSYLEVGTVPALIDRLREQGVVTKIQQRVSGPHRGGIPFARGSLFHLLKNPVYRGKIVHKGNVYDGEHPAIVDDALWNAVQAQLKQKAPPRRRCTNTAQPALLRGLLRDPEGRPMVPTYGAKGSRRYTYYETRKDLARPDDAKATRISCGAIEQHIVDHFVELLRDPHALRHQLGIDNGEQLMAVLGKAYSLATQMNEAGEQVSVIHSLVRSIEVGKDVLHIDLNRTAFGIEDDRAWLWKIPAPAKKPFREARLRVDAPGHDSHQSDPQLIQLLADALEARRMVLASPGQSLNQIATREGCCRTRLAKLLRLSWLSPRLVELAAAGTQPKSMTKKSLLGADLPLDWSEQERMFGLQP